MRHFQHVLHHDAAGNAHVFSVSAIIEQKIFAKIFLPAAAVKTAQARRGVRRNDAQTDSPPGVNSLPYRSDLSNHFVAEYRGRLDHLGVIATLPNFEVSTIGESKAHAEQNFVSGEWRDIDFFETQVLAPVQHGGHHF
jgi:hypothetical protein